ncbi:MAG: hypothetical protein CSA72_10005 [Rhodobacterales bacterium]|nr:MAG: hypothetical protein CSA72_10005 [Rhodobacterales bacterium]
MSQLDDLNDRLSAALARLRAGLDALPDAAAMPPAQDDEESAAQAEALREAQEARSRAEEALAEVEAQKAGLEETHAKALEAAKAELEAEREGALKLGERVEALQARITSRDEDRDAAEGARRDSLSEMDAQMQALQASNADLRETIARLAASAEAGLGDPEQINRALKAELEALRAVRSAEAAELSALLAELKPIIEEAS